MNHPQTLMELSGVTLKTDLEKSVLILIDYQNEYVDGQLPLDRVDEAVASTKQLLGLARRRGVPVIHVVHRGEVGGPFDLSAHRGKIISALAPRSGEVVIEKRYPNSFAGTALAATLTQYEDRRHLILAGLMTHMCLSSTASAAIDHDYTTTVVASTTTTRDLKGVDGTVVPASQIKRAALATLKDRFSVLIETPEELE
jgi:nicotinamidase-related amidase